jgi:small subunit ribosomal protein S11
MSEEVKDETTKKTLAEESSKDENKKEAKSENKEAKSEEAKPEEKEEAESFSFDTSSDDELPEEIKEKLEKNKAARAKKKMVKKKKKKASRTVRSGSAHIQATYNNTVVTLTDENGDVISWASAGLAGFKGAKKATPYAAQIITKIAVTKAKEEYGLEEVSVFVKGVGTGRESAIRALNANGLNVVLIKDKTAVPHNGCRPKKPRRV